MPEVGVGGGASDFSDSKSEEGDEGQVEEDDPEGRMPQQLPSNVLQPTDYLSIKAQAVAHCGNFTVSTKHKGTSMVLGSD